MDTVARANHKARIDAAAGTELASNPTTGAPARIPQSVSHAEPPLTPKTVIAQRARVPLRMMGSNNLDVAAYHRLSEITLESLQEVYEECADDEPTLSIEVDYAVWANAHAHGVQNHRINPLPLVAQDGVLNVAVGERGHFVLNKQAPNLQLWLSSPISGPLRYDFSTDAKAWVNSRDGHELLPLLADDFEQLTGHALSFHEVADAVREAAIS